jgi:hypothetical protein
VVSADGGRAGRGHAAVNPADKGARDPGTLRAQVPGTEVISMPNIFDSLVIISEAITVGWRRFEEALQASIEQANRRHRRAALLSAYRQRKRWNGGDERRLRAIGIDGIELRRWQRAKAARPKGHPSVDPFLPWLST